MSWTMRFLLCLSLLLLSLTRRSNAWRIDSTIGRCREEYRPLYNPWIRGGGGGGGGGDGNHVEDDEYEYEEEEEEDMDVALPKKDEKVYQTSKKDTLSFTKQKQTTSTKKQHYPSSLSREAFELVGLWRLDQSLDEERLYDNSKQRKRRSSKAATTSTTLLCAATIELTANGNVIVEWQDPTDVTNTTMNPKTIIWTTHWKIRPSNASWRGKTTVIEFEARAFQGPNDRIPRMLLYKGYLHRKWTDRKVLQIVGELYLPLVSSSSSSKRLKYHRRDRVGSFVARRRIDSSTIMNQDDEEEEEEEDENDDEIRNNDAVHDEANSGDMENEDDDDVDEQ